MFRFLFVLENGEPPNPAVFVTMVRNWIVGQTFLRDPGDRFRILGIDTDLPDEIVNEGFSAVFTIEPRERRRNGRPWGDASGWGTPPPTSA